MANTVRIKRRASGSPGAPASLANAELAFNEVDNTLYYGKGTGGVGGTATTVEAIGGAGAFVDKSTNQTIGGVKTFTETIVGNIDTASKLATARTITIAGDVDGSTSFDGSANATINVALDNTGVTAGTYGSSSQAVAITVDAKGRVTNITTSALAGSLTVAADSGTADTVTLGTDTLTFEGGNAITTTVTDNKITIAADVATTTTQGVASFSSTDFNVSSGTVTVNSSIARLASPTFTGTPAAPTATAGTNTTQLATTAFVQTAISNLIDAAPSTLDTLNELAAALGDDPNFATTITTSIGEKLAKASNLSDLTDVATARTNLGLGTMAVQNATSVAITGGSITNLTTFDGITIDGGTF